MVQYKLTHFNTRGRAELSRLILAAAGQKHEDVRYEKEELAKKKASTPFGTVPIFEVQNRSSVFKLSQSISIGTQTHQNFLYDLTLLTSEHRFCLL